MIFKEDGLLIGHYIGRTTRYVANLIVFPIIVGVIYREWAVIPDFIIGLLFSIIVSYVFGIIFPTTDRVLKFKHAMSIAAFSWILMMGLTAIPFWLSGYVNSYLDGCFEAMSGLTTTGFSMLPDADHTPKAINFWRHFLQFFGGVGIVMFMLAALTGEVTGMTRLYLSEGRDERISPNTVKTSRVIFGISLLYLFVGTMILWPVGVSIGMSVKDSLYDAITITMAGFSTGGFGPHSQNILYYHSMLYELGTLIIVFVGALNFMLHYVVLTGNRKELFKNLELLTFLTTISILSFLTVSWLLLDHVYSDYLTLFRKGFYILLSGHTTAGFQTEYPLELSREWTSLPKFAVTLAMMLGACACSTGGGIKALRVGVILKSFQHEVKKYILPETAVVVEKYHHIQNTILTDKQIRNVTLVSLGYVALFVVGSIVTMLNDYEVIDSMFETASAVGNAGLSVGIANYQAPTVLKVTYILLMWAGRLEIMPVFVLWGISYTAIKGIKRRARRTF